MRLYSFVQQSDGLLGLPRSNRFILRQINVAVSIGIDKVGVQCGGNIQKCRQILEPYCPFFRLLPVAEILNGSQPVNVRQEAVVTQSHLLQDLRGVEVEQIRIRAGVDQGSFENIL